MWSVRLLAHLALKNLPYKRENRLNNIRGCKWRRLAFCMGCFLYSFLFFSPSVFASSFTRSSQSIFNLYDAIGLSLSLSGFLLELISDWQLYRHTHNTTTKDTICTRGLWKYMRHPNYIGNVMEQWGLFFLTATLLSSKLNPSVPSINKDTVFYPSGKMALILCPLLSTASLLFGAGIPAAEWALKREFVGDESYVTYIATTDRFLPLRRSFLGLMNMITGIGGRRETRAQARMREEERRRTEMQQEQVTQQYYRHLQLQRQKEMEEEARIAEEKRNHSPVPQFSINVNNDNSDTEPLSNSYSSDNTKKYNPSNQERNTAENDQGIGIGRVY